MLCRQYQSAIEKERDDFGTVQDSALLEHLKDCSVCKRFHQRLVRMENMLRNTPGFDVTDKQVVNLCAVVSQTLDRAAPIQSAHRAWPPVSHFRLHCGLTAAAAMLFVSLLGVFYVQYTRPAPQPDPAARFVAHTAALQNRLSLMARRPEQSMQAEMQKLTGHARSAVTFLADCIPASPAAIDTSQNPQE